MRTKLFSQNALATELGIDRRTIAKRLSDVPADGKLGQHDGWFLRNAWVHICEPARTGKGAPDVEAERCRLIAAQADRAELSLAREKGELLDAKEVHRVWSTTLRAARDTFRMLPMSSADRLLAASTEGRVPFAAALLAEIDDCLHRIVAMDMTGKYDPPADEDDDA